MKFSCSALAAALVVTLSSSSSPGVAAFTSPAFVNNKKSAIPSTTTNKFQLPRVASRSSSNKSSSASSLLTMGYSVGIVGATGAVGSEVRSVLETRDKIPIDKLRIFGSKRSAGKKVDTKYGEVEVELFSVDSARECDVVFLAVDGDFALEHAEAICAGDDGAVVIDNSVSIFLRFLFFVVRLPSVLIDQMQLHFVVFVVTYSKDSFLHNNYKFNSALDIQFTQQYLSNI